MGAAGPLVLGGITATSIVTGKITIAQISVTGANFRQSLIAGEGCHCIAPVFLSYVIDSRIGNASCLVRIDNPLGQ